MTQDTVANEQTTYCAVHPDRETSLQCNKCGRYMCVQCAVQTPVGYRCRECVRGIEDKFFTAKETDYGIVFAVCAVLSAVGGYIAGAVGFLLVIIIMAAPVGGAIAGVALRVTQRRRGRYSAYAAAAGTAVGGLAPLLYILVTRGVFVPDISVLLYAGIAAAAVYARFAMRL
jgi:hypothetical protein